MAGGVEGRPEGVGGTGGAAMAYNQHNIDSDAP